MSQFCQNSKNSKEKAQIGHQQSLYGPVFSAQDFLTLPIGWTPSYFVVLAMNVYVRMCGCVCGEASVCYIESRINEGKFAKFNL